MIKDKKIIPIVFATDDIYVPILSVALRSILDNASKDNCYKIYILNTELSAESFEKINEFNCDIMEIKYVNVAERMDKINKDKIHLRDYYTKAIYYRIFIPDLFPQYDKILYLDCDIVLLEDVANLYNQDVGDNVFIAVHEETMTVMNIFGEYSEKFLGVERKNYFNSGLLLINTKKYIEEKIEEKFIELMHAHKFEVAPDQDYLNFLCKDKIKYAEIGWNKTPFPEEVNPFDENEIKLVHYKLNFKPWHYYGIRYEKYFWQYARKTPYYEFLLKMRDKFTDEQAKEDERGFVQLQQTAKNYIESEVNYKAFEVK